MDICRHLLKAKHSKQQIAHRRQSIIPTKKTLYDGAFPSRSLAMLRHHLFSCPVLPMEFPAVTHAQFSLHNDSTAPTRVFLSKIQIKDSKSSFIIIIFLYFISIFLLHLQRAPSPPQAMKTSTNVQGRSFQMGRRRGKTLESSNSKDVVISTEDILITYYTDVVTTII